ncbi:MAG: Maf family nucleotide pyrophosphatase [Desulfovibrio sp.]|uniref:Maf family nucleotide pyrophosphatase n=1 Tax=Desulfovibrio sp. TaxID=885 RepID=UPI0039E68895
MTTQSSQHSALFTLTAGYRLLLASGSPRRRQFLSEWGLPFELARPDGAEPLPEPGESPDTYTRRAATAKAHAVAANLLGASATGATQLHSKAIILAADTVVAVDGDILGKPNDPRHALSMLQRLTGRGHEVISAVCLLLPSPVGNASMDAAECPMDTEELVFSDVSRVFFHPWPEDVLRAYVNTGEPHDKAGAYAIQGHGAFLVDKIEGSWSTVVGLPVTQLAHLLLNRGFMQPSTSHT